jgi:signal transduction histidine kinase
MEYQSGVLSTTSEHRSPTLTPAIVSGVIGQVLLVIAGIDLLRRELTVPSIATGLFFTLLGIVLFQRTRPLPRAESAKDNRQDQSENSNGWDSLTGDNGTMDIVSRLEARLAERAEGRDHGIWDKVIDCLPDGVAVTSLDGQLQNANRTLSALLKIPADRDVRGAALLELLQTAAPVGLSRLAENAGQNASCTVGELQVSDELADGVLRVSCSPLLDPTGQMTGHVWTVRDVTHHKLAEQMRDQFVFTATHELRTPLSNLKACAETLALHDDIDVESQKQFCNLIHTEATRLARFVDELLNISQMESGALTVHRSELAFERLVAEVVAHVRPQIDQKEQTFECVMPAKLPKLDADKDMLTGALVNLLGNAVKYTPARGAVRLEVECSDDGVAIHVQDSGIGISPAEQAKVFDRFFRSEDPRVREETGTGLGLSFAREVARLHNGRLAVHSELNRGSRFSLTLPLGQPVANSQLAARNVQNVEQHHV